MTVMIRPLVLTLMNRKVKADKDYNLSYITSFFKNQQKKLIRNNKRLKILSLPVPTPTSPTNCLFLLNILLFKENFKNELKPCWETDSRVPETLETALLSVLF